MESGPRGQDHTYAWRLAADAALTHEETGMRKLVSDLFISLDGVVEAPHEWHFPYYNDEMAAAVDGSIGQSDTLLLGRKTYDSFAGAWPQREIDGGEDAFFARKLGDARKIVVSQRPLEFTWR